MAKKPTPKAKPPKFLCDIDEDEIVGGGIPDEDGMIYLNRPARTKDRKEPKKRSARRPARD